MVLSYSQPFAGIGVTYARDEKSEAERQHENVQHGMFLCDGIASATGIAKPNQRLSRLMAVKCHRAHRFSRREEWGRYRNLIKTTGTIFMKSLYPRPSPPLFFNSQFR